MKPWAWVAAALLAPVALYYAIGLAILAGQIVRGLFVPRD